MRLMSWLTPCPELGLLILDWSRFAKAGGLPVVVGPIVGSLLRGDVQGARKLAFTQQMLSGLPDSGAWGGEARSDTTVRIETRNRKCVETLQSFLDEIPQGVPHRSGSPVTQPKRIAVLYGAYHIASLSKCLYEMGCLKAGREERLVAWSMNAPFLSSAVTSVRSDTTGRQH